MFLKIIVSDIQKSFGQCGVDDSLVGVDFGYKLLMCGHKCVAYHKKRVDSRVVDVGNLAYIAVALIYNGKSDKERKTVFGYFVQTLIAEFGATILPDSIKPVDGEERP